MFTNRLKGAFKMSSNIVLDVRRVEKNYNTTTQEGKENIYSVLKGISFQVHKGEFISIMGSSGCGKTTLLKIIGMLNEPSKGTVLYKGKNIQELYGENLARIRRTEIAFVFQDYYLMNSLTVKDNIMLPLILNENDLKEGIKSVRKIAAEFGISNLLDKYPYELSGGEKQRTAICRAMIENPELILADEPTGNLDSNTSLQVIETLVHINETLKKTVVMVTHDPKMASYGKKTLFLKDGVILDSLIKKESNEKYYEKILNKMVQI